MQVQLQAQHLVKISLQKRRGESFYLMKFRLFTVNNITCFYSENEGSKQFWHICPYLTILNGASDDRVKENVVAWVCVWLGDVFTVDSLCGCMATNLAGDLPLSNVKCLQLLSDLNQNCNFSKTPQYQIWCRYAQLFWSYHMWTDRGGETNRCIFAVFSCEGAQEFLN
jgi:hypothetical protein